MSKCQVKERPIPLLDHEVLAILEDRQTQTRIVVEPQPVQTTARGTQIIGDEFHEWPAGIIRRKSVLVRVMVPKCPYGVVGDRLWVREGHRFFEAGNGADYIQYRADEKSFVIPNTQEAADAVVGRFDKWRPSIHMPRWACRLLLEVKAVRVERVQDVTEEDARADGAEPARAGVGEHGEPIKTYRTGFVRLWNSINEKRGFGWLENPFVWVVTFRRVEE